MENAEQVNPLERRIYDALAKDDEPIRLADVREFLSQHPELALQNASVEQRGFR